MNTILFLLFFTSVGVVFYNNDLYTYCKSGIKDNDFFITNQQQIDKIKEECEKTFLISRNVGLGVFDKFVYLFASTISLEDYSTEKQKALYKSLVEERGVHDILIKLKVLFICFCYCYLFLSYLIVIVLGDFLLKSIYGILKSWLKTIFLIHALIFIVLQLSFETKLFKAVDFQDMLAQGFSMTKEYLHNITQTKI